MRTLLDRLPPRLAGPFRGMAARPVDPNLTAAVRTLRETALFRALPEKDLRVLADAMHYRDFKRGEHVYFRDDPGLGLYVVQAGAVRLLLEDPHQEARELRRVEAGGFFGELSLLGEFRRTETAQAVVDARLIGFFRPDLAAVLQRHPRVGAAATLAIAQFLAARETELLTTLSAREGHADLLRHFHHVQVDIPGLETPSAEGVGR